MSPFFLKTFRKDLRCRRCKALEARPKKSGYSLCEEHLVEAREKFRCWSEQRREDGLCCYCPRKSFRGWLRCRLHTAINRAKCLAWDRAHPEHAKEQWELKKQLRDAGFCPSCRDRNPLEHGMKRCEVCTAKGWAFNRQP